MPLDNSLNVSELLRRLGVKGDSLGSAPLLESLRLSLQIGDLSDLVPPVSVPFGGATLSLTSGAATFNKWSLQSRSPGGLTVQTISATVQRSYSLFITDAAVFAAPINSDAHNYSFGQEVQSLFSRHTAAALVGPGNTFRLQISQRELPSRFMNWVGPGQFFNIEATTANVSETLSISWKEYPGALNPG